MKKIFTAVVALALALTVVAPAAASAQTSASYTFNTNLTIGSRGADVVALQSFLETKGLLTIPAGVAKGYFGSMTRSALAAYQTMKGIKPAAGYFGPITRAAVMADAVATPVVPGTPVTPTTPGMVNTGVEGTLDVRLAAAPADNANVQTQNDVPVYGLELKARLADVAVQTVDLQVSVNNNGFENPGNFINTIKVWDGSNVVATIPVNSSTFTKDSNSVYYVRLSGLNYVVPKDATKFLTFSFSTNYIDASRTVIIDGYNTSSMRTVSGNGVNSFYSLDGLTKNHTFKKPGDAVVTVSVADQEIRSKNIYASSTTLTTPERIDLTRFNAKSTTGDSKLTKVTLSVSTTTSNSLTSVELWDGSTMVGSRSITGNSVAIDNLNVALTRDTTKTFVVKGNFSASATNNSTVVVSVASFDYEKPNGTTVAGASGSVTGATHYVYASAAEFAIATTPTIVTSGSNANGSNTSMTAVFELNTTPKGGTMAIPTVQVVFANAARLGTETASTTVTAQVSAAGGQTTLSENSATKLVATATLFNASVPSSGTYYAFVKSIAWSVAGNAVTQLYGFEDYKTLNGAAFSK
ncbi:MAG: trimeric autotransporter adhesin [Candidatus Parcubacteria bacterium]